MATLIKSRSGLWRVYKSERARKSALTQLVARREYNYFVCYRDVNGPAINAAIVPWVGKGNVWVDR